MADLHPWVWDLMSVALTVFFLSYFVILAADYVQQFVRAAFAAWRVDW